jgi:heme/copper-type cytochrome/quinol oxidase subunit 2
MGRSRRTGQRPPQRSGMQKAYSERSQTDHHPPAVTSSLDRASSPATPAGGKQLTTAMAVTPASGEREDKLRWPTIVSSLCSALALVVPLCLYFRTLAPTVTFIDSGELITDGWTLSISHPTGYPLYTLLAYLIEHTLGGNAQVAAWRMNAFSAVMAAAACFCSYGALLTLMRSGHLFARPGETTRRASRQGRAARRRRMHHSIKQLAMADGATLPTICSQALIPVLALAGALLLAGSITFWSRATVTKMYTFNLFFIALTTWLALAYTREIHRDIAEERTKRYGRSKAVGRRPWTRSTWLLHAWALITGLSFTNHLISVIIFPAFLTYILISGGWTEVRNHLWTLLLALLLPLLLYLYLPIRAAQHPIINWDDPETLANFIRHIRGAQYASQQFDLQDLGSNFQEMLTIVPQQFGFIALEALALPGIWWLWRAQRQVLVLTLLLFGLDIAWSLTYTISEIDAYYLPAILVLSWWMALGIGWLLESVLLLAVMGIRHRHRRQEQVAQARHPSLTEKGASWVSIGRWSVGLTLAAAITLALPATTIAVNYAPSDQHQNELALHFVENAFASFAPNALVLSDNWDFLSPAWYYEYVLGQRRDVATVDISLMHYKWYYGYLQEHYPWLLNPLQPELHAFMVLRDAWEAGQPVDTNELQKRYIGLIDDFIRESLRAGRPVYLLPLAGADPDLDAVGQSFYREPDGLGFRIWMHPGDYDPPLPHFDLRGLADGTVIQTPLEQATTALYPLALARLGAYYVQYKHDADAITVLQESLRLAPNPQVSVLLAQAEQQLRASGR